MICSYVGSHRPMMVLAKAPGRPAGRVEEQDDGKVGSLAVEGRLEKPRTRDPAGQHLDLLNGSLVSRVVFQSSGLVGACGRLGFVA